MTIKEMITELQKMPNKNRTITIVVGNEDENYIDTTAFEFHHVEDLQHPVELFIYDPDFSAGYIDPRYLDDNADINISEYKNDN